MFRSADCIKSTQKRRPQLPFLEELLPSLARVRVPFENNLAVRCAYSAEYSRIEIAAWLSRDVVHYRDHL